MIVEPAESVGLLRRSPRELLENPTYGLRKTAREPDLRFCCVNLISTLSYTLKQNEPNLRQGDMGSNQD